MSGIIQHFAHSILNGASKSAEGGWVGRPCRGRDRLRRAPRLLLDRLDSLGSERTVPRECFTESFLIKRAWAVLAILQRLASGLLDSGRGFTLVVRGAAFPALDTMIFRDGCVFCGAALAKAWAFVILCACCARVSCRDLVDTPRMFV